MTEDETVPEHKKNGGKKLFLLSFLTVRSH